MRKIQQIWEVFHLNLKIFHMYCVVLYAENTPNVLDNVQKSALLSKVNSAFHFETIAS